MSSVRRSNQGSASVTVTSTVQEQAVIPDSVATVVARHEDEEGWRVVDIGGGYLSTGPEALRTARQEACRRG
jgi:hypothetical protein